MVSLSMLWGLVNGLQILAYFPLLNILIPANVLIVDQMFYLIATFDILPMDVILDSMEATLSRYENPDIEDDLS